MNLNNKSFRNNLTGEIVKVKDSFENIAILESKEKISVNRLMDANAFTEYIDPANFFNNQAAYNILTEKIKDIPMDQIRDEDGGSGDVLVVDAGNRGASPTFNESAVMESDPEQERLELAQKYSHLGVNVDSLQKQNDAFSRLLGDDADDLPEVPQPQQPRPQQPRPQQRQEEPVTQIVVNGVENQQVSKTINSVPVNDPVTTMFRNVKRNVDFKVTLDILNKIPRKDFIEMMEDSYEISIIDFLADEFTNKLLNDPSIIRDMIKSKLKQVVYGGEVKKKEVTEKEKPKNPKKVRKTTPTPPTPPPSRMLKEGEEPAKPKPRS